MNAAGTVQYATSGSKFVPKSGKNNGIWLSKDFGATWKKIFTLDNVTFQYISTNGNGIVITVNDAKGLLYYSRNFGKTFEMSNIQANVVTGTICMSSSGQYQTVDYTGKVKDENPGTLYSSDYGANWSKSDLAKVSGGNVQSFNVTMNSTSSYQMAGTTTIVGGAFSDYQIYVSKVVG